ncbi:E3 ubiquitin-protein ligase rad18, partial [Rhizophlyctis rosea]
MTIVTCEHTFCSLCIRNFLEVESQCPTCRVKNRGLSDLMKNRALDDSVEMFIKCREQCLPLLQKALSNLSSTSSQLAKLSYQPLIPSPESADVIVDCPICSQKIKLRHADAHIGNNCKKFIVGDEPSSFVLAQPARSQNGTSHGQTSMYFDSQGGGKRQKQEPSKKRAHKPSVVYSLSNEKTLRKMLKDDGLPTTGDKPTLQRRHQEWIKRYNANLDSRYPLSDDSIRREVSEWEKTTSRSHYNPSFASSSGAGPSSLASVVGGAGQAQAQGHEDTVEDQRIRSEHAMRHAGQFEG